MTLKEFMADGIQPHDYEPFKQWIRMEIAKMVAEADTRHLVYTSFDKAMETGVKNVVIRHIFTEWDL